MLQPRDLKGRTAISYARWSSERQGAGDSLRRQTAEAERFCATYGLTLDGRLVDDGISAFKGANLEAELGRFVEAVEGGHIPRDAVLLVEALDRISRANHDDAYAFFRGLLRTGITVVTLMDSRVHTHDDYRGNVWSVMQSFMTMAAAHDYSAKISERVKASWGDRAEKAKRGTIKISKVPFWIDRKTQKLNRRAEVAKQIFAWAEEGLGAAAITQRLNDKGIPSPSGNATWGKDAVATVLASKAAYGSYTVKDEEVRDYFPPVVSEARWLALRSRIAERRHNPQASNHSNLFTRLLRCAHCGSPMDLTTNRGRTGDKTYRYLCCSGKAFNRTDCEAPNWNYNALEDRFLGIIGALAIPIEEPTDAPMAEQIVALENRIATLTQERDNFLLAVAGAADPSVIKALTAQAEERSKQIGRAQADVSRHRESAARYVTAAETDLEADYEEIQRLAREDRGAAKRLIANLVDTIKLETVDDEFRVAHVALRYGTTHPLYFDKIRDEP